MQVSRMLPSSRAYSRTYNKLTLVSPGNYGQLKGQFNVGNGRSDVDQKSVTLRSIFWRPQGGCIPVGPHDSSKHMHASANELKGVAATQHISAQVDASPCY